MPLLETRASGSALAYGLNSFTVPSAWESIQTFHLTSDNTFIDFTNIPQTYKHLKVVALMRGSAGLNNHSMRLNGDSGASWQLGFSGSDGGGSSSGGAYVTPAANTFIYGTSNTSIRIINEININNYTDTNKWKTADMWIYSHHNVGSGYTSMIIQYGIGHWKNTSAVTSVTFTTSSPNAGSKFELYGLKG